MREYTDLYESYEGDFILDGNDLKDTGEDYALVLYQWIRSVLNTKPGEYAIFPLFGFNADMYEGQTNSEALGFEIANAVKTAISQSTLLYYSELEVTPFPVGKQTIALRIRVITAKGKTEKLTIAYDTRDNFIKSLVFNDTDESGQPRTIKIKVPPTINGRAK